MNQKGFANIVLVVIIIVLLGAVGYFAFVKKSEPIAQQPTPIENNNIVLSELQRLNIEVTGQPKQVELELPAALSDANWGLKKIVCEEGGYNLSAYAGQTVLLTQYLTSEIYSNTEPLNVWVVSSGGKIVCVYKTVTENSNMAPGVFSVKENPLIKKK